MNCFRSGVSFKGCKQQSAGLRNPPPSASARTYVAGDGDEAISGSKAPDIQDLKVGLTVSNLCSCGWRVPKARYPCDPMPGVQRRRHWENCSRCIGPYAKRPATLCDSLAPLRNEVATKVLARKLAMIRAAGLSWTHDAEVKEIRPSLWPGAKAVQAAGCRKLCQMVSLQKVRARKFSW